MRINIVNIEKFSENCWWLKSDNNAERVLYSIQQKEILVGNGKGVIPFKNIERVTYEPYEDKRIKINIHIKENTKWNKSQKQKRRILWKLGLINKSQAKIITLGATSLSENSKLLSDFLMKNGVAVDSIADKNR